MRSLRCLLAALMLLLLLTGEAAAMDTGFSTQPLSQEDVDRLRNKEIILLEDAPKTGGIKCFDVREDGIIALGFRNPSVSEEVLVCIYDSGGAFQYGYKFACTGDFGLEWSGDNLLIYFVRSDLAHEVDPNGNTVQWAEIQNTIENNDYWNHCVWAKERIAGDTVYRVQNDMGFFNLFAFSYSQLSATNANGEEKLLYDVNQTHMFKTIAGFIGVVLLLCCIAYLFIVRFKEIDSKKQSQNQNTSARDTI